MSLRERQVPYGGGHSAVIAAAIRLVGREGLARLSFRTLAAEAGVSVGAVRHSFPTIDDVLRAALQDCLESYVASIDTITDIESLFRLTMAREDRSTRSAFEVRVMLEAQHRPGLAEIATQYYDNFARVMRGLLSDSTLPADDAFLDFLSLVADGLIYQRVVFGSQDEQRLARWLAALRSVFSRFALPDPSGDSGSGAAPYREIPR